MHAVSRYLLSLLLTVLVFALGYACGARRSDAPACGRAAATSMASSKLPAAQGQAASNAFKRKPLLM
ncbi:MAG: hypothetical protein HYZ65_13835 [Burkholderiales bacterium]|nr:hypothetical protein [Burkholderiales bacterium]